MNTHTRARTHTFTHTQTLAHIHTHAHQSCTHMHTLLTSRYTNPNRQSRALTNSHYPCASWGEPGRGGWSLYIYMCEFLKIAKPAFLEILAADSSCISLVNPKITLSSLRSIASVDTLQVPSNLGWLLSAL